MTPALYLTAAKVFVVAALLGYLLQRILVMWVRRASVAGALAMFIALAATYGLLGWPAWPAALTPSIVSLQAGIAWVILPACAVAGAWLGVFFANAKHRSPRKARRSGPRRR